MRNICQHYHSKISQIDVILLSDTELYKLNLSFLQHNTYTDIITFPYHNQGEALWADIYISYERMLANAHKYKVEIEEEWLRLLAHGILHLLGFTDKKTTERANMRREEDFWINHFKSNSSQNSSNK